jgi:putative heme iron utilization protein
MGLAETFDPVLTAKRLVREARMGALASLRADGAPYASLVTVATAADNAPLLLLSRLAWHTENILRDPRVSLLIDERGGTDPLSGARVSLTGRIAPTDDDTNTERRFLARHPSASGYASFADFGFWRVEVESGHLVAGFGRIVELKRDQVLTATGDAVDLLAAEEGAIAHMNEDHREAIGLYATRLLGAETGTWKIIGIDPEGCDLMAGEVVRRLDFPQCVNSAAELRKTLAALADKARRA